MKYQNYSPAEIDTNRRYILFAVFVLSVCGITYELILGSLATYLLGDPVTHYSITIGIFLSSMGFGSWISRFINGKLLSIFIVIESLLGLIGGLSVLVLYYVFAFSPLYYVTHILFLVSIGILVGLEIPVTTRILKAHGSLKDTLSSVLSLDYAGGLAGALLFPLIMFPLTGRLLTGILTGIANSLVALLLVVKLRYDGKKRALVLLPLLSVMLLIVLGYFSPQLQGTIRTRLFQDDIVFVERSRYQEMVLTRSGGEFRLYLDGALQFSTFDEYRYHEMLVYPALYLHGGRDLNVLVMGGGDGLAVKRLVSHERVARVTLVELDAEIIRIARENSTMRSLNDDSLNDQKVTVVTGDAFSHLQKSNEIWDIIIADFPDPHDEVIAKLYSLEFYRVVYDSLSRGGLFVTQSTSPLFATEAYWTIHETLKEVFPEVLPYHTYIPTFGDWGFQLAGSRNLRDRIGSLEDAHGYYTPELFRASLTFPQDSRPMKKPPVNTFDRPVLYRSYIRGWKEMDM